MFITNTVRLGDAFASPVFLAAVTALTMTGAAQAQTKSWHHRDLTAATGTTVLAGCGKTRILGRICKRLSMSNQLVVRVDEVKRLDLRLVLSALPRAGALLCLAHTAPTGSASRFRIRTRL